METSLRQIPARSKRQVMDWSLVLASQEIETTIVREEGWALVVSGEDLGRATAAIEQYQKENHSWNWRQPLPGTRLIFHWGTLAPCVLLVIFFVLGESRIPSLRNLGMVNTRAILAGQWWRLFTAIFLHVDVGHLIANMTTGFILFGMAMARYSAGVGLLAAFLAGVAGNLAGIAFYPESHRSLGASGMIMGALGLLGAEGISAWRTTKATHWLRRGAGAAFLVLVLLGFSEGTDVFAHVGGFFAGALLGVILHFSPEVIRARTGNSICLVLLTALSVLTWWLALKS
ncbi:MAG: rhomboid family intramembrane serine protease [Verrucomicrobiota bacterium]